MALKMNGIQVFDSFEAADDSERLERWSMSPDERLEILERLRSLKYPDGKTKYANPINKPNNSNSTSIITFAALKTDSKYIRATPAPNKEYLGHRILPWRCP
jgi:hypothetical protein